MHVQRGLAMLKWAFLILLVGLLVGLFGFTAMAGASYIIAKVLSVFVLGISLVTAAIALTKYLSDLENTGFAENEIANWQRE
jgi:uncharacterized membrane protein YtjA (UPF0391 family)